MSQDGIEAPIGPVLGRPRSVRERVRIAAVAVVAVIVLGAGIGLAGNGFTNRLPPGPTAGSAAATDGAVTEPTGGSLVPSPTRDTSLDCYVVPHGAPPDFQLEAEFGGDTAAGVSSAHPSEAPGTASSWPVPGAETAIHLPETLGLLLVSDGCIGHIVSEYAPADPTLSGPFPIAYRTLEVAPRRSRVRLGVLPSGDWVVRVVADLATGDAGQPDTHVVERFFRVTAGAGAGPLPTPNEAPAVACKGSSGTATPPNLILTGLAGDPVAGIEPGTGAPPNTDVVLGEPLEIRVEGDRCALRWSIVGQSIDGNQDFDLYNQENPTSDPFLFAQNRWPLAGLPTGLDLVTATVRFSADVSISRRWALLVTSPDFPAARFVAADGSSIEALTGCGSWWDFPGGYGGYETCPTSTVIGDPDRLAPLEGTPVKVEVPGWTVLDWSGSCGRLDPAANPTDPFITVDFCDLGHAGGSGPIEFLPRASGPVVRIAATVQRDDGVIASGLLYATIEAVPRA